MTTLVEVVSWLAIAYFALLNVTYAILIALSFMESGRYHGRAPYSGDDIILRSSFTPPVSILVPAYNEEATIADSIRQTCFLEYGEYEVIVIDDGSTDGTFATLEQAFDLEPTPAPVRRQLASAEILGVYASRTRAGLTVVRKANGGKADALNAGVNLSRYPLICAVDADAILEKDALLRVVKPFIEDPSHTIATAGIVRVLNGCTLSPGVIDRVKASRKLLPLIQNVEYLRAFLAGRTGWSRIRALSIISGAFGVFRKDAVVAAGGWRTDTVGEDMDLALRLRRVEAEQGGHQRVVFVPDPVVWTQVPETVRDLAGQRNRWQRGLLESLVHNRGMIANPRYGTLGCLALPYNLLFEVIGPFVEVAGYFVVISAAIAGLVDPGFFALFFLLAVGCGVALSTAAILLEEMWLRRYSSASDLCWLFLGAVVENFGYRQLTALWRVWATFDYLRGTGGWGHIQRQGLATDER